MTSWKAPFRRQEYSVNLYLGSPSKVPIFAHGMGAFAGEDAGTHTMVDGIAKHGGLEIWYCTKVS